MELTKSETFVIEELRKLQWGSIKVELKNGEVVHLVVEESKRPPG